MFCFFQFTANSDVAICLFLHYIFVVWLLFPDPKCRTLLLLLLKDLPFFRPQSDLGIDSRRLR